MDERLAALRREVLLGDRVAVERFCGEADRLNRGRDHLEDLCNNARELTGRRNVSASSCLHKIDRLLSWFRRHHPPAKSQSSYRWWRRDGWKAAAVFYVNAELDLVCVCMRVGTGSQKITSIFPEWKNGAQGVTLAWALDLAADKAVWSEKVLISQLD